MGWITRYYSLAKLTHMTHHHSSPHLPNPHNSVSQTNIILAGHPKNTVLLWYQDPPKGQGRCLASCHSSEWCSLVTKPIHVFLSRIFQERVCRSPGIYSHYLYRGMIFFINESIAPRVLSLAQMGTSLISPQQQLIDPKDHPAVATVLPSHKHSPINTVQNNDFVGLHAPVTFRNSVGVKVGQWFNTLNIWLWERWSHQQTTLSSLCLIRSFLNVSRDGYCWETPISYWVILPDESLPFWMCMCQHVRSGGEKLLIFIVCFCFSFLFLPCSLSYYLHFDFPALLWLINY